MVAVGRERPGRAEAVVDALKEESKQSPGSSGKIPEHEFYGCDAFSLADVKKVAKDIGGLKGKLGNEKFLANAKAEVVEEQRERLATAEAEAAKLEAALKRLADLG